MKIRKMSSPYQTSSFKTISDNIRMASGGLKEVSSVAVVNGDSVLFGLRNDNLLWSLPGGHLNANEAPHEAAARELFEETGIKASVSMHYLGQKMVAGGYIVHAFEYDITKEPTVVETMTTKHDPDQEFRELRWVHQESQEWADINGKFHYGRNVVFELMGIDYV